MSEKIFQLNAKPNMIERVEAKEDHEVESEDSDDLSSEDETSGPVTRPYNALLQSFQAESSAYGRHRSKRRKVDHEPTERAAELETSPLKLDEPEDVELEVESADDEEAGAIDAPVDDDDESDDDDEDSTDPFELHFSSPDEKELAVKIKEAKSNKWQQQKIPTSNNISTSIFYPGSQEKKLPKRSIRSLSDLKLKGRLAAPAKDALADFNPLEQEIVPAIFNYQDLLFGAKTLQNAQRLRQITCLHALNHIFKTRDRVIKNNAKLAREPESDLDLRDQGFTRPKVLVLLETRNHCAKMVDEIVALCDPEQQENKKRFQEAFVDKDHVLPEDRPEDFRELFEGNDDNEFRIGLKFTRKTIKFFSAFYGSDIIFASALGLRRVIEHKE